ncbi:Mov34/MPN/PAD-1 family protein [Ferroglobus placidus DSM 10642]|uniref:Mov34/MPN/PAD-1 family protein n=1 Tax=Ferroglobus placidus (strain DSM 10642 / AEDII12DO) TaxID=589924 RepID=D3RWL0_FERPA|nr:Mov34/MPN/PAD-1 family protein [Ferroglobus placidus DSM 10642]
MKLIVTENIYRFLNSVKPKGNEIERCGLLLGKKEEDYFVDEVYEVRNVKSSTSEFELDAAEALKIFEHAESVSKEVVGVWHTHPFWKAYPSAKDVSGMKIFPGVWVIVSREEIRAFVLEGEIREVEIVIA